MNAADEQTYAEVLEEFPKQLERCKALLQTYKDLGSVGAFGAAMIASRIEDAEEAWESKDAVMVTYNYIKLQNCT
jgi:hypothetical protein